MRINIAGAGAGKTTKIANKIIACHEKLAEHLNIYCIAFTNNAAEHISNKLSKQFGNIPKRIKVSTIHKFLYNEIIKPYYFLLYGKHYTKVTQLELPINFSAKNRKIIQLENRNILHVDKFSQRALWVMVKKSSDKKREKEIRQVIHKEFAKYCGAIFIDEAQDIDQNVLEILNQFHAIGIELEIMGDPNQDLKGFGSLRQLVEMYPQNVVFITECHRCPQIHLDLSNKLLTYKEKQKSNKSGNLTVIFESDIDVKKFIDDNNFDLKYISQRNNRYETFKGEHSSKFDILYYELIDCVDKLYPEKSIIMKEQLAYFWTGKLLQYYTETQDGKIAMNIVFKDNRLSKKDYANIIRILQNNNEDVRKGIVVDSIESIKGKEGYNCLFILTTDLAKYLFGEIKSDNKTKNKLYVALTRSLDKLTILITKEVEEKYGKDVINRYLQPATIQG